MTPEINTVGLGGLEDRRKDMDHRTIHREEHVGEADGEPDLSDHLTCKEPRKEAREPTPLAVISSWPDGTYAPDTRGPLPPEEAELGAEGETLKQAEGVC